MRTHAHIHNKDMFLQVVPCLKEGCIGPRRAFPGVSTHLTYFPGGCRQVVPLASGKSPLVCVDFQGNTTFSRKTSKEKAAALVAGGLSRQGFVLPGASRRPESGAGALHPRAALTWHQGREGAPPHACHLQGCGSDLRWGR